jgi:hypothetical protein
LQETGKGRKKRRERKRTFMTSCLQLLNRNPERPLNRRDGRNAVIVLHKTKDEPSQLRAFVSRRVEGKGERTGVVVAGILVEDALHEEGDGGDGAGERTGNAHDRFLTHHRIRRMAVRNPSRRGAETVETVERRWDADGAADVGTLRGKTGRD